MPTGYTADIDKDISFEQFAMGCARAFGALIMMRDEPADAPIPDEFKPRTFHLVHLESAKTRLVELEKMDETTAARQASTDWDRAETARLEQIDKKNKLRAKYEAMLAKVNAWAPPGPDHMGFKEFMVEQITSSIDFDCGLKYYETPTPLLSTEEWRAKQIEKAKEDIAYHEKGHAEEVERCAGRTEWVRALRESLK